MSTDTVTLTIDGEDGTDELTIPAELVEMLREGEEVDAEVIGDLAMFGVAQRIHGAAHHGEGEPTERVRELNERTMELFEERFGQTFGELTGHDH